MIELHNVSKFYSNKDTVSTGFSKVDLNLDMGEFVVITGESGSGKSTLLNVISGLDSYEEGELFIAGEDTSGYRTEDYERYRKKYIGNIFQDFNLVNSYTVYQNVELSMMLSGMPRSEQKQNIPEYIEMVDMTAYTKTKASKLSGGQKQRVAIARALAKNAPVIVADEPTGNLDSASAEKVMERRRRTLPEKSPCMTAELSRIKKFSPRQGTFPMMRWNPIFIRRKNERKKKRRSLAAAEEP